MSVNIYKKETDTLQKVAGYGKIDSWTGTQAEFDALDKSTLSDNCYINITDDMADDFLASTVNSLIEEKLGVMFKYKDGILDITM